jgi:RimJ/RimL family protein N-acetyltransferase
MFTDDTVVFVKNENSKRVRSTIAYHNYSFSVSECRVCVCPKYYFLCSFRTDEWHWNKGFATRILKYILRNATNMPIELAVLRSNAAAVHLYSKFGFVELVDEEEEEEAYDDGIMRMVYNKKKRI